MQDISFEHLVALRRDLHAHPQAAYEEHYAARRIGERLDDLGIEHTAAAGTTGVIAWIHPADHAAAERQAVAIRADMDALPIRENSSLPWSSQHPGCMHACGHDGHTAILLGVAEKLSAEKAELPRPVKLLFQPAEESGGGAERMIADGALDERTGGCRAGRIFALHNWPLLPVGTIAGRAGLSFAGNDRFEIRLEGGGGHVALPHLACDPIVATAQLIQAIQTIVSRTLSPTDLGVVSVAQVHAGDTHNVIPAVARLCGSIRYGSRQTRERIARRLDELTRNVADGHSLQGELKIDTGYPALHNDAMCMEAWRRAAQQGGFSWTDLDEPMTGSEDFAFYTRQIPGGLALLGAGDADHSAALHTPVYDFNDEVIPIGVQLLTSLAMENF